MRVYLSGTITADPRTHTWREDVMGLLWQGDHVGISPMRGKDPKRLSKDGLKGDIPASLFVRRDINDIHTCDIMLIYFPKGICPDRQSIGTWAEFGIAIERSIPIIVVSDDPQVVEYPFIKVFAAAIVPTLEEAVEKVRWLANGL